VLELCRACPLWSMDTIFMLAQFENLTFLWIDTIGGEAAAVQLASLFSSSSTNFVRLRGLRIGGGVENFELAIQSIAVGCPLLEYVNLNLADHASSGCLSAACAALGALARLRRLRTIFIQLSAVESTSESGERARASLFAALDKIIVEDERGNVLENLFVDWTDKQGTEFVDQHFLFKVLANCKHIRRVGYPFMFVFDDDDDDDREGGEVDDDDDDDEAVDQFLAAIDNAKFVGTTTEKLTLAPLGTHQSIQILRHRLEEEAEAAAARTVNNTHHQRRRNNRNPAQRIQWMAPYEWWKLSRSLWNRMVWKTLDKPPFRLLDRY